MELIIGQELPIAPVGARTSIRVRGRDRVRVRVRTIGVRVRVRCRGIICRIQFSDVGWSQG